MKKALRFESCGTLPALLQKVRNAGSLLSPFPRPLLLQTVKGSFVQFGASCQHSVVLLRRLVELTKIPKPLMLKTKQTKTAQTFYIHRVHEERGKKPIVLSFVLLKQN